MCLQGVLQDDGRDEWNTRGWRDGGDEELGDEIEVHDIKITSSPKAKNARMMYFRKITYHHRIPKSLRTYIINILVY